jgi:hypothetical protein
MLLGNVISSGISSDISWSDYLKRVAAGRANDRINNSNNYHCFCAWKSIQKWFSEQEKAVTSDKFLEKLLRQTRVIWFEVPENRNAVAQIEAFNRLNSGKIPLTAAELIKGHFLKPGTKSEVPGGRTAVEIALEWDLIERALQKDALWYFLVGEKGDYTPTRIDFIFESMNKTLRKAGSSIQLFNEVIGSQDSRDDVWKKVKRSFDQLGAWFDDRENYHLIGFLTASRRGSKIPELLNTSLTCGKTELKNQIKKLIKDAVSKSLDNLSNLVYPAQGPEIKDILLLFNILAILGNESSQRFAFDRFFNESWTLEHIHAQNSRDLSVEDVMGEVRWLIPDALKKDESEMWHEYVQKALGEPYLAGAPMLGACHQALNDWYGKRKSSEEPSLRKKVNVLLFQLFGQTDDPEDINNIDNLALLDSKSNIQNSNHIFPVKRQKVISKDMNGEFIPIATKNVFLKYYSKGRSLTYIWNAEDKEHYKAAIEKMITDFVRQV